MFILGKKYGLRPQNCPLKGFSSFFLSKDKDDNQENQTIWGVRQEALENQEFLAAAAAAVVF